MIDLLPVYIGFDEREAIAFDVCRHSILRHASIPLYVTGVYQDALRDMGIYRRRWEWRDGQRVDLIDEKPFSTSFSFSRFLVPALNQYRGWALFCDCDMLFMADVAGLLPYMDESKAVVVAKQDFRPAETVKMDGAAQQQYHRKGWSAFMLLNCSHPATRRLHVSDVNERDGSYLHQFQWLADDDIGELPPSWNWLEGTTQGAPKVVHYSRGGPWFAGYEHCAFATEWRDEFALAGAKAMKEAA